MKRKLGLIAAAALFTALLLLLWKLDLPHWKKLDVSKLTEMPAVTTVFDRNGAEAGTLQGGENRRWTSLDKVPKDVQKAFIAAEDLRFYRHHGVDLYRLMGALWQDIRTLSYAQGGSTITQQLIKLTHLTQAKTLSRKAQELVLALHLEKVMDKPQILEAYLNAVYFGHGAYGIEAASNTYFGKQASELTLAEGALLAGVIKSPSNYAPHLNPDRALSRRNSILSTMAAKGLITQGEYERAQSEALHLSEDNGDDTRYSWYMDAALKEASHALGLPADEVISGGYLIYTGLDVRAQEAAEGLFSQSERFPESAEDGTPVQACLAALDTESGELLAVIGGRSYDVQRGLNRAVDMQRQPGSAFKPVSTYAAAIDAYGYIPSSIIDDTPKTFAGGYTPGNAGGKSYGHVTMREALSRSLNIATVALADSIGTPALRTYAQRFGIPLAPEDANLSLALGSLTQGVSPAHLGAAYCALANGGMRVEPHIIRRIEDSDGCVVYQSESANQRAVGPGTAYMVTDMLKTAASRGSARALSECGFPVAGKTGTVADPSGGTRDIWTVAYTPELAVSVWMGYDNPGDGHLLPETEGGSGYPARLCAAFLQGISEDLSRRDFPRPSDVKSVLLDSYALENDRVALLSTEHTPADQTVPELFHDGETPRAFSGYWNAPEPVDDLKLLSSPGQTPVLAFTVREENAEYVLTRTDGDSSEEVAVLSGDVGDEVRFADTDSNPTLEATYALLPRNGLLYARGELLTGPMSNAVKYVPGGLLNAIMGVGKAEATPTPTEVESVDHQSLFS